MGKFVEFVSKDGVRVFVRAESVAAVAIDEGGLVCLGFAPLLDDAGYIPVRGTLDEVVAKLSGGDEPRPALHPTTQAMLDAREAFYRLANTCSSVEWNRMASSVNRAVEKWQEAGCPGARGGER